MKTFTSPRTRSALTSHELSALGSLMSGGGSVAKFHVSLLSRVLRGAQAWYRHHPDPHGLSRHEHTRLRRIRRSVHRFLPVTEPEEPRAAILAIQDSRYLLDDYAVLTAATVAAQAHGPLNPGVPIRAVYGDIRPREHRGESHGRRESSVPLAA